MKTMTLVFNFLTFFIFAIISGCFAGTQNCFDYECNVNDNSLRFFLLGDWGGTPVSPYYTPNQKDAAKLLAQMSSERSAHFLLTFGDNFYVQGVKDVNDPRFKTTFEDVYKDHSLQIPWYLLAGNHDHLNSVQGQIDYTSKSSRWYFMTLYYPIHYNFNGIKMNVLMIDTIMLCGNSKSDFFSKMFGVKDRLSGPSDKAKADEQIAWIEENLKNSKADYLFVAGHYPVYSIAEHGSTQCLIDKLLPLLEKYKATAYLCGHDHNLQHLHDDSNGKTTHFIVSGAGARLDPSKQHQGTVPQGSLKYFWPDNQLNSNKASVGIGGGGFVYTELNTEKAHFEYYKSNGDLLYQFDAPRRQI